MNIMQQKAIERLNLRSAQSGYTPVAGNNNPVFVLSPEVIMYGVQDVMKMTGYSKKTVLKLFGDPDLPKLYIGRKVLVEAHSLIAYCAVTRDKTEDAFWREV